MSKQLCPECGGVMASNGEGPEGHHWCCNIPGCGVGEMTDAEIARWSLKPPKPDHWEGVFDRQVPSKEQTK